MSAFVIHRTKGPGKRLLWIPLCWVCTLFGCAPDGSRAISSPSAGAFEDGSRAGCDSVCDERVSRAKAQFEKENPLYDHVFVCVEPGTQRLEVQPRQLALRSVAFYEINPDQPGVRGRRVPLKERESYRASGTATRRFAEIRVVNVGDGVVHVEPDELAEAQQDAVTHVYSAAYAAVDSSLQQLDITVGEVPAVALSARSKVLYSVMQDSVEHMPELRLTIRPDSASASDEVVVQLYALP